MRIKRSMPRALRIIVSVALTVGAMITLAPSAAAAGSGSACPAGRLCFYFNSDLGGARADYVFSDSGLDNELFTDGPSGANGWAFLVDNNAASVRNNLGHDVFLYDLFGCKRVDDSLPQKGVLAGGWGNLSLLGLKNKVSSIRVLDGTRCIDRNQTWA